MDWSEFTGKLVEAKKLGVNNGLSVPCIANLIYAGAFDEMIGGEPDSTKMVSTYTSMYEEMRDSLKSKAKLPGSNATMSIGLDEVKNEVQLGLWRYIANPMSKFNFIEYCQDSLAARGFCELTRQQKRVGLDEAFLLHHTGNTDNYPIPSYLIEKWGVGFTKQFGLNIYNKIKNGERSVSMVGIITVSQKTTFADGAKKRLKIEFYNGNEVVKDLVVWQDRISGKFPAFTYTMNKMSYGVITVKPGMWGSKRTGTIIGWDKFVV